MLGGTKKEQKMKESLFLTAGSTVSAGGIVGIAVGITATVILCAIFSGRRVRVATRNVSLEIF